MNGAGKSSIGGAMLRAKGAEYYNPDEGAQAIREQNPGISQQEANSLAWKAGAERLRRAIDERKDFTFESTLGARSIPGMLAEAAEVGAEVHIWFVGLESVELHTARVRARVKAGGHDIPEADIRRRFDASRENLVWLMPKVASVRIYDNSIESDPKAGRRPKPRLLLHLEAGRIVGPANLRSTPAWAKPLVAKAIEIVAR